MPLGHGPRSGGSSLAWAISGAGEGSIENAGFRGKRKEGLTGSSRYDPSAVSGPSSTSAYQDDLPRLRRWTRDG